MSREEKIQENIRNILEEKEILAYNITYTFEVGQGLLSITLYTEEDVKLLKELIGFKNLCDKSGFSWIKETNTVLITGIALLNLDFYE